MSNWEEQVRGDILSARPYSPQPNWDKMSGLLETAASQQKRRRWLIAACIGGLLLLGAGLWTVPQHHLDRAYAFDMRQSPGSSITPVIEQGSASSPTIEKSKPAVQQFMAVPPPVMEERMATVQTPIQPVSPVFTHTPTTDLSNTTLLSKLPEQVVTLATASPTSAPVSMETFPSETKPRWSFGIRTSILSPSATKTVSPNGDIIIEEGYGTQPGAWAEVACLLPNGFEVGVAAGGHSVWQPIQQEISSDGGTFSDVWGRAFGGLVQARKYFLQGKRVQPFFTAQTGAVRQNLTYTEFTYQQSSQTGTDPHNFWKFRKDLPETAIITSTTATRSVLASAAGAGLQFQLSEKLGLFASSQANYQWITGQKTTADFASASGLYWEHSVGLRFSM